MSWITRARGYSHNPNQPNNPSSKTPPGPPQKSMIAPQPRQRDRTNCIDLHVNRALRPYRGWLPTVPAPEFKLPVALYLLPNTNTSTAASQPIELGSIKAFWNDTRFHRIYYKVRGFLIDNDILFGGKIEIAVMWKKSASKGTTKKPTVFDEKSFKGVLQRMKNRGWKDCFGIRLVNQEGSGIYDGGADGASGKVGGKEIDATGRPVDGAEPRLRRSIVKMGPLDRTLFGEKVATKADVDEMVDMQMYYGGDVFMDDGENKENENADDGLVATATVMILD